MKEQQKIHNIGGLQNTFQMPIKLDNERIRTDPNKLKVQTISLIKWTNSSSMLPTWAHQNDWTQHKSYWLISVIYRLLVMICYYQVLQQMSWVCAWYQRGRLQAQCVMKLYGDYETNIMSGKTIKSELYFNNWNNGDSKNDIKSSPSSSY